MRAAEYHITERMKAFERSNELFVEDRVENLSFYSRPSSYYKQSEVDAVFQQKLAGKIYIFPAQLDAAKKLILAYYPGKDKAHWRAKLRKQLIKQVELLQGCEQDLLFPYQIKLGKGILWLDGSGDEFCRSMNAEINHALGLIK